MIQNRTITVNSGQPASSKWWWIGDIRKIAPPEPRNEITCAITDSVSITNSPPMMTSSRRVFVTSASAPNSPPSASAPVSPMKMRAGAAFHHRNPVAAPIIAAATIAASCSIGAAHRVAARPHRRADRTCGGTARTLMKT